MRRSLQTSLRPEVTGRAFLESTVNIDARCHLAQLDEIVTDGHEIVPPEELGLLPWGMQLYDMTFHIEAPKIVPLEH
jgi:hypothetical protein